MLKRRVTEIVLTIRLRWRSSGALDSCYAIGMALLLGGCVSSRVEEARQYSTGIETDEVIVILGRASYNDREAEVSFIDCIADVMASVESPVGLISQAEFKDRLYPWFEPRTAPMSASDLTQLFAKPGVQEQIEEAGVRYLAWIDGDTVRVDEGGSLSCTISTFGAAVLVSRIGKKMHRMKPRFGM